jgi:hypothetical protein
VHLGIVAFTRMKVQELVALMHEEDEGGTRKAQTTLSNEFLGLLVDPPELVAGEIAPAKERSSRPPQVRQKLLVCGGQALPQLGLNASDVG